MLHRGFLTLHLLLVSAARGYVVVHKSETRQRTALFVGDDIIAKARQDAGMPDIPEAPQIFDDDLLDDMQQALLSMEQRLKEGPGSLTSTQVDALGQRLDRIVQDMKANQHEKPAPPAAAAPPAAVVPPPAAVTPPPAAVTPPPAAVTPPPTATAAATTPPASKSAGPQGSITVDISNDEGPAWDGKGGMGQPRGTVNTYIIEGMDEMDSNTYRLALQQSLIDRQRARRKAGKVGNRGSLDYLSTLGKSADRKIMKDPDE